MFINEIIPNNKYERHIFKSILDQTESNQKHKLIIVFCLFVTQFMTPSSFLLTPFPNQEVRAYDWMDLVLTNRPVLRALHF